jgi:4-diphosphocytidyl-2-C-methyl-D-erythritol kinase
MRIKAFAKINLFLKVKGVLENGYHDLEMVNIPIDLFDSIHVVQHQINELTCNHGYIPTDYRNTIWKTLDLLQKDNKLPQQKIHLVKNIPSQAGLAGGSADAAALINYFNDVYKLGYTQQQLFDLALEVGADVPFCILNQCAKVEGIGEKITPINRTLDFYLFLMKPNFGISTKELFLEPIEVKDSKEKIEKIIQAIETDDYKLFLENMTNDLQTVAIKKHPKIKTMIDELIEFGFDQAMMSGSGSVVYGVTQNDDLVDKAVKKFYNKVAFVKKSRILG